MGNDKKKTAQQNNQLENEKDAKPSPKAGQSGAQSGNPGMQQQEGAPGQDISDDDARKN